MSDIEDRLRATLGELADEARPAPLLQRLEQRPAAHYPRRHVVVIAAAAAVAVLIAVATVVLRPHSEDGIIEPTVRPPKILRLSGEASARPGRGAFALVLRDPAAEDFVHEKPAYLLPLGRDRAVLLDESDVEPTSTEHLSVDGSRIIRWKLDTATDASGLEIVNLVSGDIDDVHGEQGVCPALSPDNTMVAAYRPSEVVLIKVRSGTHRVVGHPSTTEIEDCVAPAWAPDSNRVVIRDGAGSTLLDRRGLRQARLPGVHPVNGSMSWSPDGRSLLLYESSRGRYVSRQIGERSETRLEQPPDAVQPVGWAGSRIVWLAGTFGDQRLVTTDASGRDPRLWMRLDTGTLPIETVSWSTPLRGAARDVD